MQTYYFITVYLFSRSSVFKTPAIIILAMWVSCYIALYHNNIWLHTKTQQR